VDALLTVGVGLGAALLAALATGGVELAISVRDRRLRRRVAAMSVLGDAAVAEAAFRLLVERRQWWSHDFGPALASWAQHRDDFAADVRIADWAAVDGFYSNLARSAAMARPPGEPATDGDVSVAEATAKMAAEAWETALGAVDVSDRERLRSWSASSSPRDSEAQTKAISATDCS
jgi:hypothetical protein